MIPKLVAVFAMLALSLLLDRPLARSAARWLGEERIENGVLHVLNPPEGLEPAQTIQLEELWRIGGSREEEGHLFGLIRGLAVDGEGFVYVMDYQLAEIRVFSAAGEFVRSIGRPGEGPGELARPDALCVSGDGEIQVAMAYPSRVVRFLRDGTYVGTATLPTVESERPPILHRLVSRDSTIVVEASDGGARFLAALNRKGEEITRYFEEPVVLDTTPVYEERSWALSGRWDVDVRARVWVASSFENYELQVWSPDGKPEMVVGVDYPHRRRSAAEKQLVHEWANVNPAALLPGTHFEIEDYDKDIMAIYSQADGSCWILSSRGFYDRPEGSLGTFDVLGNDGRFLRRETLMGEGHPRRDRFYFHGDRLYVVTCFTAAVATMTNPDSPFSDECEDPMSVICYQLPW